jgi:predicted transposase/invertase (TIGR01784 family)
MEEGVEKGIEQGRIQGIEENARKMKAAGVAPERISAWTGLSVEEIEKL